MVFSENITQIAFMYIFCRAHSNSTRKTQNSHFSGSKGCGGRIIDIATVKKTTEPGFKPKSWGCWFLFFSTVQVVPMATLLNCLNSNVQEGKRTRTKKGGYQSPSLTSPQCFLVQSSESSNSSHPPSASIQWHPCSVIPLQNGQQIPHFVGTPWGSRAHRARHRGCCSQLLVAIFPVAPLRNHPL